MNIGLAYQNRSFCAMLNYFSHASSYPSFRNFRDPYFINTMQTVASVNYFETLTIERLTVCVNAEHQVLKKAMKKVVMEHCEEGHRNCFCQFTHDGSALKNKDKCQAMGMHFEDKDCKHNNGIALAFLKPVTHKADDVSTLAKEVYQEFFGCEFQDIFSSAVQDLAASAVANELNVDKVECDMHQGDKVGASTVGELFRTANKVKIFIVYIILV